MSGDSLDKIQQICRPGSVLGLERLVELLRRMGDPQNKLRYVHVAGSNGKGSMCAMLAAILTGCGYKTGMYTSPQLLRLNERYRIDGAEIDDETLAALAESVRQVAMGMEDIPTEFEITTAMMFEYFHRQRCDIVVLEVGMGGALDATNVIPAPEVAMIGNIALEHTRELGDTIEKIAFEKAGIIKSGCAAVTYPAAAGVEAVFDAVCAERHVPRQRARTEALELRESTLERQRFVWGDYPELTLHLAGSHQRSNAVMVLECVEQLRLRGWDLPRQQVADALAAVRWPARLEVLRREPLFLLDGAHNPQCMETLAENLTGFLSGEKAVFLMGVMADKEYDRMIELVRPFARCFVCVTPKNDRALPAGDFAAWLQSLGCEAEMADTVAEGVRRAVELAGDGPTVACGSLYMAGEIRMAAAEL